MIRPTAGDFQIALLAGRPLYSNSRTAPTLTEITLRVELAMAAPASSSLSKLLVFILFAVVRLRRPDRTQTRIAISNNYRIVQNGLPRRNGLAARQQCCHGWPFLAAQSGQTFNSSTISRPSPPGSSRYTFFDFL